MAASRLISTQQTEQQMAGRALKDLSQFPEIALQASCHREVLMTWEQFMRSKKTEMVLLLFISLMKQQESSRNPAWFSLMANYMALHNKAGILQMAYCIPLIPTGVIIQCSIILNSMGLRNCMAIYPSPVMAASLACITSFPILEALSERGK